SGQRREKAPAVLLSEGAEEIGVGWIRHHDAGIRVEDHILELGARMGDAERDRDSAGAPDRPLQDGVLESRWYEERHSPLVQIVRAVEQARRDARGGCEQLAVGELSL